MKTKLLPMAAAGLFLATSLCAQEVKSQEALEAKFKETMADVTMTGRSTSIKDGVLGPEKEDKYNIVSVEKLGVDSWVINARMKYESRRSWRRFR